MAADIIGPWVADIHLLTVLAETRSFTQAARRLGLSKASVSMRIGALERAAGVPLVQRTTRSVVLTEAGRELVADAAPAFERIDAGFTAVKDLSGTPRGTVRVTAPVALGRQHVSPRLAAFFRNYPEVRIHLDLTDRFVNLAQEGYDLAIRHTAAAPESYVAWPLCETRSLLVASPAYLRRRGTPRHPRDLADHDCVLYLGPGADTWTFVPADDAQAETLSVPVQGPLKANNSEVLRDAVLDGLGIGLLPDFSAAPAMRRLRPVLPDWRVQGFFGNQLYALRPWAPRVPRAVQCFVEYLRDSMAQGFPLPD
ncbi:MAG: LysR family transcriptional regulator [Bordetella sp. SCN 67-23]|nr:LysR family transcriptional regulator [Burkholderiales bacterium]ODS74471.1 MAG: LysR family transcriptional regulator [Bordetella sp. SCN 67-23]ODU62729.1 MAG: LysR family transcriptional regulator [Bordetella sp. SCN 68-11]OJW92163.1 MAG: LysR family transcriptional regulator [Burkholderiales bacterium 67-32]